jgi:hypothetical protein
MRFEPSRIHFNPSVAAGPARLRFDRPRITVRLRAFTFRKVRLKRGKAVLVRPPELLRRVPEDIEARPTGFHKYDRRFTAEGGIELRYNDVERTLPVILGKLALWVGSAVVTYYAGCAYSPIDGFWWNLSAYLVLLVIYGFIFFRDKQVERLIEIRPDCMIIEGMDTFWKANMQLGWPGFQPNEAGHFVLGGVYGSRWIEYLTIRRFDQNDRAPELFAHQLAAAMKYQWDLPSKGV